MDSVIFSPSLDANCSGNVLKTERPLFASLSLCHAEWLLSRSDLLSFKMASCSVIQKSAISLRHYILNMFCTASIFADYEFECERKHFLSSVRGTVDSTLETDHFRFFARHQYNSSKKAALPTQNKNKISFTNSRAKINVFYFHYFDFIPRVTMLTTNKVYCFHCDSVGKSGITARLMCDYRLYYLQSLFAY